MHWKSVECKVQNERIINMCGTYSLSQNCWDTFVSSHPLNVGVHDLVNESQ